MQADTTQAPCPTERDQFEAWVEGPNNRIRRDPWGMYCQSHVQRMWEGWLAARFAQAPAPQGPALVPLTDKVVGAITDAAGFFSPIEERAAFISGLRHGEAAHGITGAPNGKPT